MRQQAHSSLPTRPLDLHRVERVPSSDPERQDVVDAGLEAARGLHLLEELLPTSPERHLGADGEPIPARPVEPDLQEVIRRERTGVVAIDEGLLVDVVDDQIERPVAVQVAVGGAAREAQRVQVPGRALIGKREIAAVAKRVIGQLGRAHRVHEPPEVEASPSPRPRGLLQRFPPGEERDVVL